MRRRTYRSFAYGTEEMGATSIVEALDAIVRVHAGTFEKCVKLKTLFERKGEDPSEHHRRLNVHNSGERYLWFAPGVGLVKMLRRHGDGTETEIQLMAYHVLERRKAYFPLEVGTTWTYQGTNNCSEYATNDVCWGATREGDTFYIAQFHTSEKIGKGG